MSIEFMWRTENDKENWRWESEETIDDIGEEKI